MSLANKFQLLELSDDEDAPKTVAVKAPETKAPETKAAPVAAKKAEPQKAAEAPKSNVDKNKDGKTERKPKEGDKPRGPRPEGGDKPRGPRPEGDKPRGPRPEGGDKPRGPRPEGGDKPRGPRPEGGDKPRGPRPEGQDRPRRPRRGEEEPQQEVQEKKEGGDAPKSDLPPKKRQYDRRGPTRKEGEKAEFHGKGNWGKPGSESTPEAAAAESAEVKADETEKAEAAPTPAPAPVEPEDKTMTLAEFKKLQAAQKKTVSSLQARVANEGSDSNAWKNTEQLQRVEEAYFVPPEKSSKKKETKPVERKVPETIEISPKPLIEDKIRERKFGDKTKKPRTKAEQPKPPKFEDSKDFPSLK